MYIELEHDDHTDPRVQRTKHAIINSFIKLFIEQRNMQAISVQEIAKNAGVNRITFYDHFKSKYDLLDAWMRTTFKQRVTKHLKDNAPATKENMEILISAVLDFFEYRAEYRRPNNNQVEPIFETAIQEELQKKIETMLTASNAERNEESAENIHTRASYMSWGIFGTALSWSRREQHPLPKAAITQQLLGFLV